MTEHEINMPKFLMGQAKENKQNPRRTNVVVSLDIISTSSSLPYRAYLTLTPTKPPIAST